jgi:predicted deacetylase
MHDVAPATWPQCARLIAMLDAMGPIPLTLLVVPDFHRRGALERNTAFVRAIETRLARGDEVALHGYYHVDEAAAPRSASQWIQRRVLTQSEGEFAALSQAEATQRLELGLQMMHRLRWPVRGFVAPAWLIGAGARAALSAFDFLYTTTRQRLYHLLQWSWDTAPALTYSARSPWRRAMSHAMIEAQWLAARTRPLVRIALHPVDARHDGVIAHWQGYIARACASRLPVTKVAWAAAQLTPLATA